MAKLGTGGVIVALAAACLAGCTTGSADKPLRSTVEPAVDAAEMVPRAALDFYIQQRWERRVDQWKVNPPPPGGTLFLGSSIIEEGPWETLFPDRKVINRGIGADTTQGVLNRLDGVIALRPDTLVLYIGGNDASRLGREPDQAIQNVSTIVERLTMALPETRIVVSTLFARELRFSDYIAQFNEQLRSKEFPDGVTLFDGYSLFAATDGSMDPAYSNDNIHLNGRAYEMWASEMSDALDAS